MEGGGGLFEEKYRQVPILEEEKVFLKKGKNESLVKSKICLR